VEEYCKKLRNDVLRYSYEAGACHIGSALSCIEILIAIDRVKSKEDFFIFGKASGVSAYYALLADKSGEHHLVHEILKQYPLPSKEINGIIHSVGSLGHGLPVAVGLAYSRPNSKVYCLMSDGELSEGTTWESLLFASHHKLNNLIVVIDRNGLQACGKTEQVLALERLDKKLEYFGCSVTICNGHDEDLLEVCLVPHYEKPSVIIAQTVKAKGLDGWENKVDSHYKNLKEPCQI
jgi:transketolase